jgi:hypothetical protein
MPRPQVWTALSNRGIAAGVDGLRAAYRWVVADVTAEFDGEHETGSIDLEERNALARTAALDASCVVVVGDATLRGLRALPRTCAGLVELGVSRDRILPIVNRFTGSRRRRSEIHQALAGLGLADVSAPTTTLVIADRREIETCHANVDPLPPRLVDTITSAAEAIVERVGRLADEVETDEAAVA